MVAKIIGETLGLKVGAPLDEPSTCDIQPKCMGLSGVDIMRHNERTFARFPFDVEVKYSSAKSMPIVDWLAQARRNSRDTPMVVVHPKGMPNGMVAIVDFRTIMELIDYKYGHRGE